MKERSQIINASKNIFGDIMAGNEYDKEIFNQFYQHMGEDIKREKERIGGDFAVAHVVVTREVRDVLRLAVI